MPKHPLAEVFGYAFDHHSPEAKRHRELRLCPFSNKVANCTKDKANDPLGVCTVFHGDELVITCPIRFRQNWLIAEDAAKFFFPPKTTWTSLTEVRLKDKLGESAGNIDIVLVAYDDRGRVTDFGALEVQAVYISGNVRNPFAKFMTDPETHETMDWTKQKNYPHPDFLSSSRKRLAPQLLFKGGILHTWSKKIAVAMNRSFFETLPKLETVSRAEGEIAWLLYDLERKEPKANFELTRYKTIYTRFDTALETITVSEAGEMSEFLERIQTKLDEKLLSNSPDAPPLDEEL